MKKIILILTILLTLVGCVNDAQEVSRNGDFNVELLFEKDGCKVYRFSDGTRYVYWSDCRGKMQSDVYRSSGKSSGYTERMESITN